VRELREHLHEPPNSPIAQELAERIDRNTREFFQGNDELALKYWSMIRPEPGAAPKVYGLDIETMDYIDAIMNWYFEYGKGREQS
jgi:hypothetical protein